MGDRVRVYQKSLILLACLVGVGLLVLAVVAAPTAGPRGSSPSVRLVAVSPAAPVRSLTADEVGAALLVADNSLGRFRSSRLDRRDWVMPVKAEGVPICNEWVVRVGGQMQERFFSGPREAAPTRFAGVGRWTWRTAKNHHYVAGLVFGSAAQAAVAWTKIGSAVAACPRTLRETALPHGVKLTARRNSPIFSVQTWTPEREAWLGGWRWLRVRELVEVRRVLSGWDSALRAVHDYALSGTVIVVQSRREWGRPDADWRGLDGRTLDLFASVLRRLDASCGSEGCGAS